MSIAKITTAALIAAAALIPAQTQPPAQGEYPLLIPNTGQQINPFAPVGSRFVWLNPGLAAAPNWYAGQAATSAVSPDARTLVV